MNKKIIKFKTKNCSACLDWQKELEGENELCPTHTVYNPVYLEEVIEDYQNFRKSEMFYLFCFIECSCLFFLIFITSLFTSPWPLAFIFLAPPAVLLFFVRDVVKEIKKDNQKINQLQAQIKREWIIEYENK